MAFYGLNQPNTPPIITPLWNTHEIHL